MRRFLLLLITTLLLAACDGASEPGRFEVVFRFDEAPPDASAVLWARGEVLAWPVGQAEGRRLTEAEPVSFGLGAALDFGEVPNGSDRVVLVELAASADRDSDALWFGVSERFDLEPGDEKVISVALALRPTPAGGAVEGLSGAVRVTVGGAAVSAVSSPDVELAIRATYADRIVVSNLPGGGPAARELRVSDPDAEGFVRWPGAWNLDEGLCAEPPCGDGVRNIFVRLESDFGHARDLEPLVLLLDSTPPEVLATISDEGYGGDDTVRVSISSNEPLSEQVVWLRDEDGERYTLGDAQQRGLTWIYEIPARDLPADGRYEPVGSARDVVGLGGSLEFTPESFVADITAPSLTAAPIISPAVAVAGSDVVVEVSTSEPLDLERSRLTLGGLPLLADTDSRWRLPTLTGAEGSGIKELRGTLVDAAGNAGALAGGHTVVFDFEAPTLRGTPLLERCDGRPEARLSGRPDEIWLDDLDCPERPELTVRFELSEPLQGGALPAVTLAGRALSVEATTGRRYVASFELEDAPTAEAEGTLVEATFEEAGLEVRLPLGRVYFDFTAPTAPTDLVYRREPWGSLESGGQPRFAISAPAGALEPFAVLEVLDAESNLLERFTADDAGGLPLSLLEPIDLPRLLARQTDPAGNVGPVGPITRVEVVATLGGARAGDRLANPHFLVGGTATEPPSPGQFGPRPDEAEVDGPEAAFLEDGVSTTFGPPLRLTSRGRRAPPLFGQVVGAFDSDRGRLVVLGIDNRSEPCTGTPEACQETWEYDPSRSEWQRRRSENVPTAVLGVAAAVYDPLRAEVVFYIPTGAGSETWTWNGAEWTQLSPSRQPPIRSGGRLAWDAAAGHVVLFGGVAPFPSATLPDVTCSDTEGRGCNDTWAWDGSTWSELTSEHRPPPLTNVALGTRPDGPGVVAFGGCDVHPETGACGAQQRDTWVWDGVDWSRPELLVRPSPRDGPQFVLERGQPDGPRLRLLGGLRGGGVCDSAGLQVCGEHWAWADGGWQLLDVPLLTRWTSVVGADEGGVIYVHGGISDTADCPVETGFVCRDTFELRGAELSKKTGNAPGPRSRARAAWSPSAEQLLLIGGTRGANIHLNERWLYRDGVWSFAGASDVVPVQPAMAYDSVQDGFLLVGSRDESGFPTAYAALLDATTLEPRSGPGAPVPVYGAAMAEDRASGSMVLFGGVRSFFDDGTNFVLDADRIGWRPLGEGETDRLAPVMRVEHAMVSLGASGGVLLFGGEADEIGSCGEAGTTLCNDTWIFAGERWHLVETADRPAARRGHQLVYEESTGDVLLFGGAGTGVGACGGSDESCIDVWRFDGVDWWLDHDTSRLAGAAGVAVARDPLAGETLLFGGAATEHCTSPVEGACGELAAYRPADLRPYLRWIVDLSQDFVAPVGGHRLESLSVVATAGGETGRRARFTSNLPETPGPYDDLPSELDFGPDLLASVPGECTEVSVQLRFAVATDRPEDLRVRLVGPGGATLMSTTGEGRSGELDRLETVSARIERASLEGVGGVRATFQDTGEGGDMRLLSAILFLACEVAPAGRSLEMRVANGGEGAWVELGDTAAASLEAPGAVEAGVSASELPEGALDRWLVGGHFEVLFWPAGGADGAAELALGVDRLELRANYEVLP